MSGSLPPGGPGGPPPAGGTSDPSMEDILASIRRILSEDEAAPADASEPEPEPAPLAAPPPPTPSSSDSDVLMLDASMLVDEPPQAAPAELSLPEFVPFPPPLPPEPAPLPAVALPAPSLPEREAAFEPVGEGLVAAEAVAAAAASMSSLARTLAGNQGMAVYRGGPTLEDIVREEMRPLLKSWLDQNLPPLVERLVRAEIDRVVGRAAV